jgi:multidrug resistance efflux pump
MSRKRKLLAFGASVIVAIGAARLLGGSHATIAAPIPVEGSPPQELLAPGLVEAEDDKIDLAFEISGRVTEVRVAEGDSIVAGQLLARLDDQLARARVARAEAALASARAADDLTMRGARPADLEVARAEAEAAEAQARQQAASRDRAEKLSASGSLSPAQLDGERSLAAAAAAHARAAAARYSLAQEGARVEVKREAAATVSMAEADLKQARVLLAQTELHAPRAGVVLRRFVEPGTQVTSTPLTVALTIADLSRLQVRAEIDEADIGGVTPQQRGYATAAAFGARRFAGHVARITRELGRKKVRTDDPRARLDTRVLEGIFVLDDPVRLPLGLRMDVHLEHSAELPNRTVSVN